MAWSDAAREASIEARRASAKAKETGAKEDHEKAAEAHKKAISEHQGSGRDRGEMPHSVAVDHHSKMAAEHEKAASTAKYSKNSHSLYDDDEPDDRLFKERMDAQGLSAKKTGSAPNDEKFARPKASVAPIVPKDHKWAHSPSGSHSGTHDDPQRTTKAGDASAQARHATMMAKMHGTAEAHGEAEEAHRKAAEAHRATPKERDSSWPPNDATWEKEKRNEAGSAAAEHHDKMAEMHGSKAGDLDPGPPSERDTTKWKKDKEITKEWGDKKSFRATHDGDAGEEGKPSHAERNSESKVQRENREAREFLANKPDHRGGRVDNRKWEKKEWKAKSDAAHASLKAEIVSRKAEKASAHAKSEKGHQAAAEHHAAAAEHHHEAAAGHEHFGNHDEAKHHEGKAEHHEGKAKEHEAKGGPDFSLIAKVREAAMAVGEME